MTSYLFGTCEVDLSLGKIGILTVAALLFMNKAIDFALVNFKLALWKWLVVDHPQVIGKVPYPKVR